MRERWWRLELGEGSLLTEVVHASSVAVQSLGRWRRNTGFGTCIYKYARLYVVRKIIQRGISMTL